MNIKYKNISFLRLKFKLELKNNIIIMSKYFIRLKSGYEYNFSKYRNAKVKTFKYIKKKRTKRPGVKGYLYKSIPATKKSIVARNTRKTTGPLY